jgi:hypothetical protein
LDELSERKTRGWVVWATADDKNNGTVFCFDGDWCAAMARVFA